MKEYATTDYVIEADGLEPELLSDLPGAIGYVVSLNLIVRVALLRHLDVHSDAARTALTELLIQHDVVFVPEEAHILEADLPPPECDLPLGTLRHIPDAEIASMMSDIDALPPERFVRLHDARPGMLATFLTRDLPAIPTLDAYQRYILGAAEAPWLAPESSTS